MDALRLLPASALPGAGRLITTRAMRGFADGFVSVTLAVYLDDLGFSALRIGAIITSTLLGSALLTLLAGLYQGRIGGRRTLLGACALMAMTGIGFASFTTFWPIMAVAFVGTLNPSAGDVSVFLPIEQSLLAGRVAARDRTALFARYSLAGAFAGAFGALAAGLPSLLAKTLDFDIETFHRAGFVAYGAIGVVCATVYLPLAFAGVAARARGGLVESRRIVLRLSALFSLDSFGGGFAVQAILALWLFKRFDLSTGEAGTIFFVAGLLTASSQLVSSWLASRIGLINTMVFTHIPANICLILSAVMPTAPLAIGFLLVRMAISQMDVPARQSYVMAVVPEHERAAAASVTNVPRSLASAGAPFLAGAMLSHTSFGWPLICAGLLKIVYDLILLAGFRSIRPPEEGSAVEAASARN